MDGQDGKYQSYLQILREELVPALGCTEPISLAYGAALARETLGSLPERVLVEVSGNIIKNVKSVVVPNTGGLRGIEAAVAAGIVAGKSSKKLEVLAEVTPEERTRIQEYLGNCEIKVLLVDTVYPFDFTITAIRGEHYAKLRIIKYHTNLALLEKDGVILRQIAVAADAEDGLTDRSGMKVKEIIDFANTVRMEDIHEIIGRQIDYNMAIAAEGLKSDYGANIGRVLLTYGTDIKTRAKAMAAAASDARMAGCELPVIIISGSGNQGIAAATPVVVYARELGISEEKLYRALVVSSLIAIHQKTAIGRLSAFCGAVSAGCAAGAGIAYLLGGAEREIVHTLVNGLAIVSGIICDGAKPSCAAKIAAAVDAGILGYQMFLEGQQFRGGDGIITKGVEKTISNVGRLGNRGMKETDKEILRIMVGEES
jgi:L-cysteine desulfidase